MKILGWITSILLIIGGLNWGLIGLANINLVSMIFGAGTPAERITYIVVGIAAVLKIICCAKGGCGCNCSSCHSCNKCNKP